MVSKFAASLVGKDIWQVKALGEHIEDIPLTVVDPYGMKCSYLASYSSVAKASSVRKYLRSLGYACTDGKDEYCREPLQREKDVYFRKRVRR